MSQQQPIAITARPPIIYLGGYFLPIERVAKGAVGDLKVGFLSIAKIEELERRLDKHVPDMVIVYNDQIEIGKPLSKVLNLFKQRLRIKRCCLIVIAARNVAKLALNLRDLPGVVVVPSTVQPAELFSLISNRLEEIQAISKVTDFQIGNAAHGSGESNLLADSRKNVRSKTSTLFKAIDHPSVINELFAAAVKTKSKLRLMDDKLQVSLTAQIQKFDPVNQELMIKLTEDLSKFGLQSITNERLLFNLDMRQRRAFFSSKTYTIIDQHHAVVKIDEPVYEVQRRSAPRIQLADPVVIGFEFKQSKIRISGLVTDVSSGGIGILVPKNLGERLSIGLELRSLQFAVRERTVKVPKAQIRFVHSEFKEVDSIHYVRIGVKFVDPRVQDRQFLNMYAYRESLHLHD